MFAFPHTFKNVLANNGTVVSLIVTTEIGGQWNIVKGENGWDLSKETDLKPNTIVKIDPDIAWKLFSKSLTPEQILGQVEIIGDQKLGLYALGMVAVMA